jgi:hypothetical protein
MPDNMEPKTFLESLVRSWLIRPETATKYLSSISAARVNFGGIAMKFPDETAAQQNAAELIEILSPRYPQWRRPEKISPIKVDEWRHLEVELPWPETYNEAKFAPIQNPFLISLILKPIEEKILKEKDGKVIRLAGHSICRLCGKYWNGNATFGLRHGSQQFCWPEGLRHYLEEHSIGVPLSFAKFLFDYRGIKVLKDELLTKSGEKGSDDPHLFVSPDLDLFWGSERCAGYWRSDRVERPWPKSSESKQVKNANQDLIACLIYALIENTVGIEALWVHVKKCRLCDYQLPDICITMIGPREAYRWHLSLFHYLDYHNIEPLPSFSAFVPFLSRIIQKRTGLSLGLASSFKAQMSI